MAWRAESSVTGTWQSPWGKISLSLESRQKGWTVGRLAIQPSRRWLRDTSMSCGPVSQRDLIGLAATVSEVWWPLKWRASWRELGKRFQSWRSLKAPWPSKKSLYLFLNDWKRSGKICLPGERITWVWHHTSCRIDCAPPFKRFRQRSGTIPMRSAGCASKRRWIGLTCLIFQDTISKRPMHSWTHHFNISQVCIKVE